LIVKIVELDLVSRQQQVRDGCFKSLQEVPQKAITLTIPAIVSSKFIYCMVPAPSKAEAVKRTLEGPISTDCPASILRKYENGILFLDSDSAKLVGPGQQEK
jgi:glucosamine-6-phosphate deaminase